MIKPSKIIDQYWFMSIWSEWDCMTKADMVILELIISHS